MFKHGEFSTEVDKGPFFFTLAAFLGSLTAALLFFFVSGAPLAIFAGILVSVVAIASGAVLFALTTDRVYILDDKLYMSYLFRKTAVPLNEIGRITCKDNVYSVYNRRDKLMGTINGQLTGIDKILYKLDECGIYVV